MAGASGLRGETKELTYRGELRRSISETSSGAVGLSHAHRTGSDWYSLANIPAQGVVYGGLYSYDQIYSRTNTFPFNLADRTRDKAKAAPRLAPTGAHVAAAGGRRRQRHLLAAERERAA